MPTACRVSGESDRTAATARQADPRIVAKFDEIIAALASMPPR